jgi:hypothetical protein
MKTPKHCDKCHNELTDNEVRCHRITCYSCQPKNARRSKEYSKYTGPMVVVHDPDEAPLADGMELCAEEVARMFYYGCFTPGTVLKDGEGRMITV